MYLRKHDLLQMDGEWLKRLSAELLLQVPKRLLHDVKELPDRLSQNPENSSRPPTRQSPSATSEKTEAGNETETEVAAAEATEAVKDTAQAVQPSTATNASSKNTDREAEGCERFFEPVGWRCLAAFVAALAGCQFLPFGFTSIGEIVSNPAGFELREVKIKGRVVDANKLPLIELRIYAVKDETGTIVVTTQGELPPLGQNIAIRGQVENALILAGKGFGMTVREIEKLSIF
jgi:hypothetical protein